MTPAARKSRARTTRDAPRSSRVVVYDAGALVAAERRDIRMLRLHRNALGRGVRPLVPAVVVAQVWRGGPQVNLRRLVTGCHLVPFPAAAGWDVGALCGRAGTKDLVDAAVVLLAAAVRGVVVTSDPGDMAALAGALGEDVPVLAI